MGFETDQEGSVAYNHPVQPPPLSSSPVSHRRRSLAYTRSPPPPPNIPIPNIPDQLQDPSYPSPSISDTVDHPYSAATSSHANGFPVRSMSYSRPSASPNLTTIAAFSHNLNVKPNAGMSSLPPDDLSDPPPQSFLLTSPKRAERRGRPSGEDGLLPPNSTGRKERQPSSRSALTRALELARQAVNLDSSNDNPAAAVEAYAQSVALLSQVMERVRRGEDGARRTRSPEAQEEEVRRLQNIHDTYADRMNILSIIYSIPATPYTSLAYAARATSSSSTSNSSSLSITSHVLQTTNQSHNVSSLPYYSDGRIGGHDVDSGEIMRQAMFPIDDAPPGPAHHPYANQYDATERNTAKAQSRFSVSATRRRAGSYLPPAAPPPAESLPPAPVPANIDSKDVPPESQQGHRRNGSGWLLRLDEKDEGSPEEQVSLSRETSDSGTVVANTTRKPQHDSPRLPQSHPPEANPNDEIGILRSPPKRSPPSPRQLNTPRSRASSQLQSRSNTPPHPHINLSPKEGAIYLRRTQTSAPSSVRSASPIESHSPYSGRPAATSLPGSTIAIPATGRLRSSSQPGRKPTGQMSSSDQRPPLPPSIPQTGAVRKVSIPSKLNPNAPSVSLTIQTDILSPTGSTLHAPGLSNTFVTTPTSPFPPAPPTDPSRKPYHMMNLLRITMTSATGGYLTPRLHIPFEVWSQGGAKLTNVSEKVRVVAILSSALEDLQGSSAEYFGAGNVSSGLALGIGSIGRKEAEAWVTKLEDFSAVCDGIEANFSKKLGIGEGLLPKKNALTGLAKRIDKFTNGKNLDSPTAYVHGLKSLFQHAQLLDEHTQAVLTLSPAYVAFPADVRVAAEYKLRRFSEFFSTVVLSFVIRDLSQLLDKYVKKCEKWLEE